MKTIHNYRDKEYVRILDSTHSESYEAKEMIGGVYEVRNRDYNENMLVVWNKDKSDFWHFNKSDTQICYPDFVIDGHVLGNGDVVKNDNDKLLTVFDIAWASDGLNIKFYYKNGESDVYSYNIEQLKYFTLHSTVYPRKEEVTELTLEDIAKKFNVDVKSLKIKK